MKKKPKAAREPPRLRAKVLSQLLAGETVELPNQGWRKKGFYDLKTEEETFRIYVEAVKGETAWVRLNQEPPDRYLHSDSSRGYAEWTELALGRETGKTRQKSGHWAEPEPRVVFPDVQQKQTEEANADWEHYREVVRPEEVAKERSRRLVNKLRKLEREATKSGIDLTSTLEDAVRQSRARILDERKRAA